MTFNEEQRANLIIEILKSLLAGGNNKWDTFHNIRQAIDHADKLIKELEKKEDAK